MPISFYSTLTEADRTKNFTYKHQLAVEERKGDIPSIPRSQTLNPETKNPIWPSFSTLSKIGGVILFAYGMPEEEEEEAVLYSFWNHP